MITAESHPTFRPDVSVLFGKYMPAFGIRSDLIAQAAAVGEAAEWPAGATFLAPAVRNRFAKQLALLRNELRVFWLAKQGYDAVQARDRVLAGIFALWAARRAGIPFFYWSSYPKPEARLHFARERGLSVGAMRYVTLVLRGWASRFVLYRYLLPRASHIFVQSNAMRDAFAARGVPFDRMTAVPMGVDFDAIDRSDRVPVPDLGISGRRLIVYLGALERIRRPEVMVRAMLTVKERVPEALLLLIGDSGEPGDRSRLESLIAKLGLRENVALTGWLPQSMAWSIARRAEVGLSTCPRGAVLDVASPTKVVEYFALGVPVVANDQPDQADLLDRSRGGHCVKLDSSEYASAVIKLLENPGDARVMGERGRELARQERDYYRIATWLAVIYRNLCAGARNA